MTKSTFALPLSIVVLSVSSLLAPGQQPIPRPVPTLPQPVSSPVVSPEPAGTIHLQNPLDATSLADFLNIHGWEFSLTSSGNQSKFCYRLVVYLDSKPVGQTAWQSDSTEWGREKYQYFKIILENVEEGIKFSINRRFPTFIRSTIKLETKLRPDYFVGIPRLNKDGSITLAFHPKDKIYVYDDSVIAPSIGHMVLVLETKEESEPAGAGQPDTKPADESPVKDQPSTPTPKDAPR